MSGPVDGFTYRDCVRQKFDSQKIENFWIKFCDFCIGIYFCDFRKIIGDFFQAEILCIISNFFKRANLTNEIQELNSCGVNFCGSIITCMNF